tara:strand:- start:127 stop:441 length:315 start_codon:yes stop_codon:yes gene_type:complete
MNKRKREEEHAREVRQRMEVENRKRAGETLHQVHAKRQRLDYTVQEELKLLRAGIQEELKLLRASIEELRTNQRACYHIMAGQAARIRQLETSPQVPAWTQWVK